MSSTRHVLMLALLALAGPAFAAPPDNWWDFYGRGLSATQRSDWTTVAAQMQRSVGLKPEEELAARTRDTIVVYVPHFWLGIARFNQGDTDGALRELHLSESQNVIQKTQYYPQLKAWVARAETEKQRAVAEQVAPNRKGAEASINRALSAQVEAMSSGSDRVEGFRSGQKKLQQALDLFNRGGNDAKAFDAASEAANQARSAFAAASEEGKAQKAARAAEKVRIAAAPPAPPVVVVPPPPQTTPMKVLPLPVTETPKMQVEPPAHAAARLAVQEYRRALDDTIRSKDDRAAAYARGARFEADRWSRALEGPMDEGAATRIGQSVEERRRLLNEKIASLRVVTPPPAATIAVEAPSAVNDSARKRALTEAYTAFATGALTRSEALLDQLVSGEPKNAAALALRGCVRYTRAMLNPAEARLLEGARHDFSAAVAIDPGLSLDQRAFSPKVIAYFRDVQRARSN